MPFASLILICDQDFNQKKRKKGPITLISPYCQNFCHKILHFPPFFRFSGYTFSLNFPLGHFVMANCPPFLFGFFFAVDD